MAAHYRLVFRGKLLPGLSPAHVTANLAELFHVPIERVQALLATQPAVIKHDVDIETGNRYLEVLAEAGMITHLEPLDLEGGEVVASGGWDGVEHRLESRRQQGRDRRDVRRGTSIQPGRRDGDGRRKTDQ